MAKQGKIEVDVQFVVVISAICCMFFVGRMFEHDRAKSIKRDRIRSLASAMVQDNLNKVAEMKGLYLKSKPKWALAKLRQVINQS